MHECSGGGWNVQNQFPTGSELTLCHLPGSLWQGSDRERGSHLHRVPCEPGWLLCLPSWSDLQRTRDKPVLGTSPHPFGLLGSWDPGRAAFLGVGRLPCAAHCGEPEPQHFLLGSWGMQRPGLPRVVSFPPSAVLSQGGGSRSEALRGLGFC